jgi:hypothetical protein
MELIMGFKAKIKGRSSKNVYDNGYLKIGTISYNVEAKRCGFSFLAWKDQAAKEEGAKPLRAVISEEGKPFPLNFLVENRKLTKEESEELEEIPDFDDNFSVSKQEEKGMSLLKLAYLYAKKRFKDVGITVADVD